MKQLRAYALLPLWIAALVAAIELLDLIAEHAIALPSVDPSTWANWFTETSTVDLPFAFIELIALVCVWYLVGVTGLAVVARLIRVSSLIEVSDAITIPFVRKLVRRSLDLTLVGVLTLPNSALAAPAGDVDDVPVMRHQTTTTTTTTTKVPDIRTTDPQNEYAPSGPISFVRGGQTSRAPQTWTVKPGDNLWLVAESTLSTARDGQVEDGELVSYWRAVVDVNRSSLRDHNNPDLIFPGQVLILPPVPAV